MSIGSLSQTSQRSSPSAVELEAQRIGAAIEHIGTHGNLDGFHAGRAERLALVSTASRLGFLVWNRSRGKYELTSRGHRHVRALRRAGRNALRDRQGGVLRSGMNAVVGAAGAVVVAGAVFLAFTPNGSTDLGAPRQSGAYFTSGGPAPVRAGARGIPAAPDARPNAVTAAAISPSNALPSEDVATALPAGRGDPPANAGVHNGEAARSLAGAIGSEPEPVTSAAQKSIANDRDRPETGKLAQKHKRNSRKERRWDGGREAVSPGYAYRPYGASPYGGAWGYRQSSASPGWFR